MDRRLVSPLLATAAILGGTAVNLWFFPDRVGYLTSLGVLVGILGYATVAEHVRWTANSAFLTLFGGYWVVLVINYYVTRTPELLPYVLVTPVAVGATVIALPQLVEQRPRLFAKSFVVVAVVFTLVGIRLLMIELATPANLYPHVGDPVMTFENLRLNPGFDHANTYGFLMMVGWMTALYVTLVERRLPWGISLILISGGLFLSEGDASFLGIAVGGVVFLAIYNAWYALGFLCVGIGGVWLVGTTGHLQELIASGLSGRLYLWEGTLLRLSHDPLWGIGFAEPAEEIYGYVPGDRNQPAGPHNSYLHILLNTGIVAGLLYISSLVYAVGYAAYTRSTVWDAYVLATTVAILVHMGFESVTLGGLSLTSVLLGIYLGLAIR